ncbi:predicted protein [Aspergillus terreus NIH2624]|uniref:Xylanolytic transcriptional activator regulatory domain-containing protein n=1 Tax=Aspergillus terreus (strain NIH 2624 / FGSC A1156) TaxID=341663 RepID=Q0CJB4_ASPTN|nr:uncharacterized protein ATEG_06220 [Aspergillus terreus NIH2624]EAU33981.1 predicted protein [Aspergillus terreus NIH2624]
MTPTVTLHPSIYCFLFRSLSVTASIHAATVPSENLCQYEAEPKGCQPSRSGSGDGDPPETSRGTNMVHICHPAEPNTEWSSEFQDKIRDFGYSSHGNFNSMSLLHSAKLCGGQATSLSSSRTTRQATFRNDANRKYKEAVRQLPSQACIDLLVQTFFSDINWQYDVLDEGSFKEQLVAWRDIVLRPPTLLFQVLALALLFHPPHDEMIGSLITMADMTFHDLGGEYSDTGADLFALLGKRDLTIATVQAGLLRASFLKSSGKVIEAWHTLGATIRDAQEIGLHTGRIVSDQSPVRPKRGRESVSLVGHKIWVVLHIWDVHMAVVLGRPIATDIQIDHFARTAWNAYPLGAAWKIQIQSSMDYAGASGYQLLERDYRRSSTLLFWHFIDPSYSLFLIVAQKPWELGYPFFAHKNDYLSSQSHASARCSILSMVLSMQLFSLQHSALFRTRTVNYKQRVSKLLKGGCKG